MKNINKGVNNKYLIFGLILLGAMIINGCATRSQTSQNSNQTVKVIESNKVTDVTKTSPTIEVVEKTDTNKPTDMDDFPDKSANNKSSDNKSKGKLADKLTIENFNKINVGMTHEEVTKIFDDKGMQTSEMHVNGHDSDMFMWSNDNFSKRISVTFEKNQVTDKTQSGL